MVDVELYGGKQGLFSHVRAQTLYALGAYRNLCDIDWPFVRRLIFVCKGNICRSPYASAKARSLGVPAVSFGLEAAEGAPADPTALRNALLRGVDLGPHRSARMESSHVGNCDLVVVFEPWQLAEVRRRTRGRAAVSLLGVWTRPIRPHIQDPYGRSDRYFQQCFSLIDANVAELVGRMAKGYASES